MQFKRNTGVEKFYHIKQRTCLKNVTIKNTQQGLRVAYSIEFIRIQYARGTQ